MLWRDGCESFNPYAKGRKLRQSGRLSKVRSATTTSAGFWQNDGLIADGRDMGTVVFPNAQVKLF